MNKDQFQSLVRDILKLLGLWAVAHGKAQESDIEMLTGAGVACSGFIWSYFTHKSETETPTPTPPTK